MNCENIYCIYQKGEKCTKNEIGVDVSGMCADCKLVNIPDQLLELAKLHLINHDDLPKCIDILKNEIYQDLEFEVKMKLVMDEYRKNHPEEFKGASQNLPKDK